MAEGSPIRTEALIVGGGMVGMAAAVALAEGGIATRRHRQRAGGGTGVRRL